jgi:hypothetical protein
LINQLEESIKNREKSIRDKEQYLKLAHTRLDIRHKRPNIELVYDPAQKCLIEEIREIEFEIQKLQERYEKITKLTILFFSSNTKKERKIVAVRI